MKSTFGPLHTGFSSILTPDSSLKSNSGPRKYVGHLILPKFSKIRIFSGFLYNFRGTENFDFFLFELDLNVSHTFYIRFYIRSRARILF